MNFVRLLSSAFALTIFFTGYAEACRRCETDSGAILDLPSCGFWKDRGAGDPATCKMNQDVMNQDSFSLCAAASVTRNVYIGGRNNDLLRIGDKGSSNWKNAYFVRIQDGENYTCGGDVKSGRNFTAVMRGRNRDVLDIFLYEPGNKYSRTTDRIQNGRGQYYVAGLNYIARIYGENHDILKIYGIKTDNTMVQSARFIADGRGHILTWLSNTDFGITYGRNKDIRVRYCFDGSRWSTGYIGIGHDFAKKCDTLLK